MGHWRSVTLHLHHHLLLQAGEGGGTQTAAGCVAVPWCSSPCRPPPLPPVRCCSLPPEHKHKHTPHQKRTIVFSAISCAACLRACKESPPRRVYCWRFQLFPGPQSALPLGRLSHWTGSSQQSLLDSSRIVHTDHFPQLYIFYGKVL